MKYTLRYIFTLLAIYFLSLGSVLAQEEGPVIGLDKCSLINGYGGVDLLVGSGIEVSASSANGNYLHTCSGDVQVPSDQRRTKIWTVENTTEFKCDNPYDEIDGCLCYIDGTLDGTDDWHQVVTPSGKAKLVCHFKD